MRRTGYTVAILCMVICPILLLLSSCAPSPLNSDKTPTVVTVVVLKEIVHEATPTPTIECTDLPPDKKVYVQPISWEVLFVRLEGFWYDDEPRIIVNGKSKVGHKEITVVGIEMNVVRLEGQRFERYIRLPEGFEEAERWEFMVVFKGGAYCQELTFPRKP